MPGRRLTPTARPSPPYHEQPGKTRGLTDSARAQARAAAEPSGGSSSSAEAPDAEAKLEAMLADIGSALESLEADAGPAEDAGGDVPTIAVCDESGCAAAVQYPGCPSPAVVNVVSEPTDYKSRSVLICRPDGCFLPGVGVEVPADSDDFVYHEGTGWEKRPWRLGYRKAVDPSEQNCAVISSGAWSVGLSVDEYNQFCRLLGTLKRGIQTIDEVGNWEAESDGTATLEVSKGTIWMEGRTTKQRMRALRKLWKKGSKEGEGEKPQRAFTVNFSISSDGQRSVEGTLDSGAVLGILELMEQQTAAADEPGIMAVAEAVASS